MNTSIKIAVYTHTSLNGKHMERVVDTMPQAISLCHKLYAQAGVTKVETSPVTVIDGHIID